VTVRKLIAISLIFGCTCLAWVILGATNSTRTESSYSSLKTEVQNLYGGSLSVSAPQFYKKTQKTKEETVDGKVVRSQYFEYEYAEIAKSDIRISVSLDPRKKGNLWFPTFKARFDGKYSFRIVGYDPLASYYLYTTLDSADSIYSNVALKLNGKPVEDIIPLVRKQEIPLKPGADGFASLSVSYDVSGMERLSYLITPSSEDIAQIDDFKLVMTTDFDNYDFPSGMMSPTLKEKNGIANELTWSFDKSVTGKDIGLVIPNKLNPGEIVTRVSFFAPVSLLFFFIVLLMVSMIMKINLHPMHYFFLAATFFSFHLMFSYFSDKWDIYASFAIAAGASLALTVTYLARFAPKKLAYALAPFTQLVYLVVFSFSFFFDGMTGIIVTICSVMTLFILMQATARIDWNDAFKKVG
jgi:Inner membrane protein CreD